MLKSKTYKWKAYTLLWSKYYIVSDGDELPEHLEFAISQFHFRRAEVRPRLARKMWGDDYV